MVGYPFAAQHPERVTRTAFGGRVSSVYALT